MSTELFLNFLGIRMDSRKAEGLRFTINLVTPDNGEKFIIEMENATLTNIAGFQAPDPDLTLTINRADLEQTMMGAKTLEAQIADGTARSRATSACWRARRDDGRLRVLPEVGFGDEGGERLHLADQPAEGGAFQRGGGLHDEVGVGLQHGAGELGHLAVDDRVGQEAHVVADLGQVVEDRARVERCRARADPPPSRAWW